MDVKVAYSFIESILTQGFLSLGLKCGDNFIVFKTLTEKEYRNLKYLCPVGDEKLEKIIRLSLSTFMINSENMLINRNDKIEVLKDFYSNLPLMAIKLLLDNITTLHTKYISSLRYFEGFCYTDKSRYLWKTLSNSDPTTCSFSGIEGTENCGMNLVQENWVNINNKFDEEEIYERDFNLSLMISSSMNPKGSKAISISYKNSRDEIEDVRSQIAHYGYDKKRYVEERKASKWSKPIKTREDLVRELEKQIRGEKDHHDLFIEQWVKNKKEWPKKLEIVSLRNRLNIEKS